MDEIEIELIDPNPDVHSLFVFYDSAYFDCVLIENGVQVVWSKRMTLCAGLCVLENSGHCVIKLSEPILKFRPRNDLLNTLLHEMIHAFLFVFDKSGRERDRDSHGPLFMKHSNRINKAGDHNITVFHNFVDEVDFHRKHVWQCDGKCNRILKRAMNRSPGPNDWWWKDHTMSCGGTYVKIAEPPKKEKVSFPKNAKKRKRDDKQPQQKEKFKQRTLDEMFGNSFPPKDTQICDAEEN